MAHQRPSLLVISSYPPKGVTHHAKIVGVASYTKNTIEALNQNTDITVLAEHLPDEEGAYQEKNVTVKRVWKRNSLSLFPTLLKEALLYYKDTKHIFIAVELAMFGGKLQLALLPLFMTMLRLFDKEVIIVLHQVITNIEDMSGHIYTYSGLTAKVINVLLVLYYKTMLLSASKVIVMDEILKIRLGKFGDTSRVVVIPHGVESFAHVPSKKAARTHLGVPQKNFVLLYFGFLAWYKGADVLVEQFAKIPKKDRANMTLIMAGGPNPNHMDKPSYVRYIKDIQTVCDKEGITVTGFVPEEDIPYYFSASDLVLFPYRTLMSASGPLSLAFSFDKPLLISKEMEPLTQTKDIKAYLLKSKLSKDTLLLRGEKQFKDTKALTQLQTLSKAMKQQRSWSLLGKAYERAIQESQ